MKKVTRHSQEKAALKRGNRKNRPQRYGLEVSPLHGQQSIHAIAKLLRLEVPALRALAAAPTYRRAIDREKPEKPRHIQEPLDATMRAHYRIARLLDRIIRQPFLHSATRKRSNVTNADAHKAGGNMVKTDIRKFFENTTTAHVKDFFFKDMGCAHDIAKLLASLCTVDGHLATGSCISPLLSYYSHRGLFSRIEQLCADHHVVMTLYVDDVTLSGHRASKKLMTVVKGMIAHRGLHGHKDKLAAAGHAFTVTGVVVADGELRVPNEHHLEATALARAIQGGKLELLPRARGKAAYAKAINERSGKRLMAKIDFAERKAASLGDTFQSRGSDDGHHLGHHAEGTKPDLTPEVGGALGHRT